MSPVDPNSIDGGRTSTAGSWCDRPAGSSEDRDAVESTCEVPERVPPATSPRPRSRTCNSEPCPSVTGPELKAWRRRVRGCLLGGALGDALGALFEGLPVVEAHQLRAWLDAARPLRWTDDTALQVALAGYLASLEQPSAFDDEQLAQAFATTWETDPHRMAQAFGPGLEGRIDQVEPPSLPDPSAGASA
jgi:hypothetical protein